jgi:hypothetical protein
VKGQPSQDNQDACLGTKGQDKGGSLDPPVPCPPGATEERGEVVCAH